MIKINLLPEAKVAAKGRAEAAGGGIAGDNLNTILIIGFVVGGLLVGGYLSLMKYNKTRSLNAQIKAAQEEYIRLEPIIIQVNKFKARKLQLEQKLNLINELRANQEGPVHILDELADLVPDLLWLESAVVKGRTMELKGFALSPNAVAEFLQRLDESKDPAKGEKKYFKDPSLKEMKETKDAHSFQLTVGFTYTPGREPVEEELPAKGKAKGKAKPKSSTGNTGAE
jgi:type IV pilus assembly protein PilN